MGDPIIQQPEYHELDDKMKNLINQSVTKSRREERNKLLLESDKYVLPDFNITTENKMKILTYRQSLRDFNYKDFSLNFPNFPI